MTAHLPWFRLYTEAVDDEKLRLLAFEDRWHFVALLCCKGQGVLDEKNKDLMLRKVGVKLGLQVREVEEVARRLSEVGLVDKNTLQPLAWDARQRVSDVSTMRVRKLRKGKKDDSAEEKQQDAHLKRDVTVSETDPDTDTETETDAEEDKKTPSGGAPHARDASRFGEFWTVWPEVRKRDKKRAAAIWARRHLDDRADMLIADVLNRKTHDRQWLDGYVPSPTTYLNGDRWEDTLDAPTTNRTPGGNGNGSHYESPHSRVIRDLLERNGYNARGDFNQVD
jgi:hypothetical protein